MMKQCVNIYWKLLIRTDKSILLLCEYGHRFNSCFYYEHQYLLISNKFGNACILVAAVSGTTIEVTIVVYWWVGGQVTWGMLCLWSIQRLAQQAM